MNVKQLGLALPALEPSDWSRLQRTLLRRPSCEWGSAAFSCSLDGFVGPNRDYAHEGLSAFADGENWKFLDGLLFSSTDPRVRFIPLDVQAFPWKTLYRYAVHAPEKNDPSAPLEKRGELHVQFYLLGKSKYPSMEVTFSLHGCKLPADQLLLFPLADLRPVHQASQPEHHSAAAKDGEVRVKRKDAKPVLVLKGRKLQLVGPSRTQPWTYKLGYGFREGSAGFPRFVPATHALFAVGTCSLPLHRTASLHISCLPNDASFHAELGKEDEKSESGRLQLLLSRFDPLLEKAASKWGPEKAAALASRTLVLLDKFALDQPESPDAGAYWFRQAWARDAFESIFVNFDTYSLGRERWLKKVLSSVWSLRREGMLCTQLDRPDSGASLDGTLLALNCGFMLLQQTPNPALRKTLLSASADFLAALEKRGHVDATTSLLKSTAHASWIDSRIARSHGGQTLSVPTRLPSPWVDGLCSRHSFDALRLHLEQPHYFLAELNALWLVFLENLYACQPSAAMEQTKATAQSHFKSLFFTPGLAPAGLVDENGNRNTQEVSSLLQAAALLPSLFSDAEVEALYQFAQPHFLDRQGKLMGVLVMVADGIPYYDDAQYHRGVSWPKTNPYLYRLLVRLRKTPQAHGLLESMLDHQQSEGAVFFSHELFSAENGGTPVKNPAQLFSQYVQPYYDALESV